MTVLKEPPVTKELVDWLDKVFPLRSPILTDKNREIWMKAGERRVVDKLTAFLNRQTQDSLEGKII